MPKEQNQDGGNTATGMEETKGGKRRKTSKNAHTKTEPASAASADKDEQELDDNYQDALCSFSMPAPCVVQPRGKANAKAKAKPKADHEDSNRIPTVKRALGGSAVPAWRERQTRMRKTNQAESALLNSKHLAEEFESDDTCLLMSSAN